MVWWLRRKPNTDLPSGPAILLSRVYPRALEAGTERVLARGCSHSIIHTGPEGGLPNGILPMDGGAGVVSARQWVSLSLRQERSSDTSRNVMPRDISQAQNRTYVV